VLKEAELLSEKVKKLEQEEAERSQEDEEKASEAGTEDFEVV
jgi:hypothetical protein